MDKKTLLFALLRYAVFDEGNADALRAELSVARLEALYPLCKHHDLAHLLSHAVNKLGFTGEDKVFALLEKEQLLAIYRVEQLRYTLAEISAILETAQIPHMPLKGSVLRDYYPEPWMRTSCDVDMLVKEEMLDAAVAALVEKTYTVVSPRGYHDISLSSPLGIHLELHFHAGLAAPAFDGVLAHVWDYAVRDGEGYSYRMTEEFFFFHQIAHAARHFMSGGCGVRPFLDAVFLYRRVGEMDSEVLHALLEEAGLLSFYENYLALSRAWFGDGEHTDVTREMENYLLGAGVYGSSQNFLALEQAKSGGRVRYALQRIFMPYDKLKTIYPRLERAPYLLPFYEVHRWFTVLFSRRAKSAIKELRTNASIKEEESKRVYALYKTLGLK